MLFIDSEGLGSTSRTATEDVQIFSLAVLLSSYFIWNSRGVIDGNALDDIGLVTGLAKSIHVSNNAAGGSNLSLSLSLSCSVGARTVSTPYGSALSEAGGHVSPLRRVAPRQATEARTWRRTSRPSCGWCGTSRCASSGTGGRWEVRALSHRGGSPQGGSHYTSGTTKLWCQWRAASLGGPDG